MFGCKCCKVLRSENEHLRGLVDRLVSKVIPKAVDESVDPRIVAEVDKGAPESETFGVG